MRYLILLLLVVFMLCGCATIIGPSVSQEEILMAQEQLSVKALEFRLKQLEKVNNIGHKLLVSIPQQEIKVNKEPQPFLGIYTSRIDKQLRQLYKIDDNQGVVVIVVIENSPSDKAGIINGDVITAFNHKDIRTIRDFNRYLNELSVGELINLRIKRNSIAMDIILKVDSIPINLPINMVDIQEVNAAATSNSIYVTYGLLNFVNSDDEVAAVLGHELAHFVRGHLKKAQIGSLLSLLIAVPLSIVADEAAPGSGDLVYQTADIFKATYSRDLEREADYFGLKFVYFAGYNPCSCANFQERFAIEIPQSMIRNYLSTHPSSPERMVRVKKAIAELADKACP